MPMFYTPKPRQFHYDPRFYDPEKEKWEALKKKYANENKAAEKQETDSATDSSAQSDLAYFQQRVRSLDREEARKNSSLGWKDLFRKREMPTFNYQPRFQSDSTVDTEDLTPKRKPVKIKRRFDIESTEYMKPVSGGKILLYVGIALMLLYWILF